VLAEEDDDVLELLEEEDEELELLEEELDSVDDPGFLLLLPAYRSLYQPPPLRMKLP
jgi:hypothetical protein